MDRQNRPTLGGYLELLFKVFITMMVLKEKIKKLDEAKVAEFREVEK